MSKKFTCHHCNGMFNVELHIEFYHDGEKPQTSVNWNCIARSLSTCTIKHYFSINKSNWIIRLKNPYQKVLFSLWVINVAYQTLPSLVEINRHVRTLRNKSECVISIYFLSPFLTSCTLPMCLPSLLLKAKSLPHTSQWNSNEINSECLKVISFYSVHEMKKPYKCIMCDISYTYIQERFKWAQGCHS